MQRIVWFMVIVFIATMGIIIVANQNSEQSTNTNTLITPTSMPSPTTQNKTLGVTTIPSEIDSAMDEKVSSAVIKTSKGDIELDLFTEEAKNTIANFARKARSGFYKNLTFHRVEDWVIQGGDPKGNGRGGGSMPTELNDKPFVIGSLGVARGPDINISNDAQFFITKKEASWLNKQYTNFGIVTKGMDVVNKIEIGDTIEDIRVK